MSEDEKKRVEEEIEKVEGEARRWGIDFDKPIHAHLAYFGSELACPQCNPNCHQNHGMGKPLWCGDENCPMHPKWFQYGKKKNK